MNTHAFVRQFFGYGCLVLAWLVTDHVPPLNTFWQEALALLAIILLWPWQALRIWPVRLCVAAFFGAGFVLFQHAFGLIDFGDMLLGLLLALFFCMAASLGAQAAGGTLRSETAGFSVSSTRGWCLALLAAALANAVVGLAQWQGVAQGLLMLESAGRVYGNFAQPNQFATLLVLALAALVYLDQQTRLRGAWPHVAALILALALVASESRIGALSFSLLVLVVAIWGRPSGTSAALRWLLPALIFFWLLRLGWQPVSTLLGGSVTRSSLGLGSSTRFELWQQMMAAIALKPWLGWGWLHVGEAQNAVAHYLGGTVNMDHAHNLFLDLAVWFGLSLGGLMVFAISAWGIHVLRSVLARSANRDAFPYLLILLPIAVHSLLEYPYAYTYFALVFAFFAGALEAEIGQARCVSPSARWLWLGSALLGVICAAWAGVEYMRVEEDFRALRFEQQFVTRPELRHTYNTPPHLLTQFGALVTVMRADTRTAADSQTVDAARRVAMRFPWLITKEHYYLVLLANGRCAEAARQRLVLKSLFGENGLRKIETAAQQTGANAHCAG